MTIIQGAYPNYLYLYKKILPTLRKQLVFKPQISSLVSSWLDNIRQNDRTGLDIIFVGRYVCLNDCMYCILYSKVSTVEGQTMQHS